MSLDPAPGGHPLADASVRSDSAAADGSSAHARASLAERRAAEILERVADAHVAFDRDLRYVAVNASAERSLGRPRSAILGRTLLEAFPAAAGSESERQYQRVLTERVEVHFAEHYVGDGLDKHVEIDAYPTDDGGIAVFWRDVTARVRAEEALRASEARYRALFDSIDVGFCVVEVLFDAAGTPADYRFVEANPAFERQTGLVNAVGRTARALVPDLESHWFETYGRVAATGEPVRFQQASLPMGRWFDVYAFRVEGAEKRQVAILFTDNSAAKAAELEREQLIRALEIERARLATVFAASPSILALVRGPDHVFELANEAYLRLIGRRDVIGKPLLEAVPELRGQGFDRLLDEVMATGQPYVGREVPIGVSPAAGAPAEERYFDFVYLPLTEVDGTHSGVIAHGNDVTEQVRARREVERAREALHEREATARTRLAELEAIYDSAPVGLCVLDRDLRFLRINERLAEINGVPAAAHLGRTVREVVPGIADVAEKELRRVMETGEPALDIEIVGQTAAQPGVTRVWVEQWLPIRDAEGVVSALNIVAEEVTAERAAAAERERLLAAAEMSRAEAEAANRAKSEFLAVMSHELRTPLNAIGGYAELMEMGIRGPVTAQQAEDLRRIQASQRHLLGLVNEVLNYARIETGSVHYDLTEVSVAAVIASVEPLVAPQLTVKGLSYSVAMCDPAPIARADREKVRQVLLNLLSNAVKFTESGGRVEVSCEKRGDRVLVRVRDTGIGIAPHELQRVFEPFVQVNASLTRTQEGTGLGLAISRDLARGMGGDLVAESEPGRGSTFTLWLPSA